MKDKDILHKDKAVEQQKAERAEAKHARRTGVPLTMAQFMEKAASTIVGNDLLWEDPTIVQRKQDLERLASRTFWQGLKVKDGFKDELKVVLPNLWVKLVRDEMTMYTKAALLKVIGEHLKDVSKIADKAGDNNLSDDDISSDMKRTDILALFVKQDATMCLSDARAAAKKSHMLRASVIASCGTDIEEEQYDLTSARGDDDDDDGSDDDDDDLDDLDDNDEHTG